MMKNTTPSNNLYVWGAILGLTLGIVSVYFYERASNENVSNPNEKPAQLDFGSIIRLGILLVGLVRQIAEIGAEAGKKKD